MYNASLIISFYKKIDFLEVVINSLRFQTEKNFEVIISDDGSPKDIVDKVKLFLDKTGQDWQYVWHEDQGWRKNIILNKSVVSSKSDLLIFIDGDCFLHKHFIEEHVKMAAPGIVRAGRRVNLSERVSIKVLTKQLPKWYFGSGIISDLLLDSIQGKARDVEQGIYVKNKYLRSYLNDKNKNLLGCNFSLLKNDLLGVNGFDERFDKPAYGEDTDLEARLRRNEIKFLGIRNQAIQYHFYHKSLPREESNKLLYQENNKNNISYTPYGIKQNTSD